MRLLFDNNLSVRLVRLLQRDYPDASHVVLIGLERGSDLDIWQYARASQHIIASKDADFHDLSMQEGSPPKVVWLRIGNCTTAQIVQQLRDARPAVVSFAADPATDVLILTGEEPTAAGQ